MTPGNDERDDMFGVRHDEARLARIVAALTAPATPAELRDERDAIEAAMRVAGMDAELAALTPGRSSVQVRSLRRKLLVPVVAGAIVVGTTGLAMAGALPAPAQDAFATVLDRVGITVPASADQHPSPTTTDHPASTGADISQIATDPSLQGLQKGIAVSGTASGGMSQAGQHGSPSDHPTGAPSSVPPVAGGTGGADSNSGGSSHTGTATAGAASGGHSGNGSGNASAAPAAPTTGGR
ncbi:MAG: hypothetical protein ACM3OO_11795 [Planctomycetaceae bacterium]